VTAAEVVVVGSLNDDVLVQVDRLPAPGETVTGGRLTRAPGGKGANAAVAAARLGARTSLVGAVGDDREGELARASLRGAGVDDGAVVVVAGTPTGVAAIMVDARGENVIAVASGANDELTPEAVRAGLERLARPDSLVLANLEIPDTAIAAAAAHCRAAGLRFVLDPAPARPLAPGVLAACTVLTPNRGELEALGRTPEELLRAGADAVAVTLGGDGVELHVPGARPRRRPAPRVQAVDTTGAGDAFAAALAVALARGRELGDAVALASAAGALATRAVGGRTSLATYAEAEALARA